MTLGTLYMGINGVTDVIEFTIPGLRVVSAANLREHWAAKAKRIKRERQLFTLGVLASGAGTEIRNLAKLHNRLRVTLIRRSPRKLDRADNLPYSMKAHIDALCALLGVDDGSDMVEVITGQEKGKAGLLVRLEGIG